MISILCPTRGRPSNVNRLIASIVDTAMGEYEILFYADDDDPHLPEIKALESRRVQVVVGPRIILSDCWNRCADRAQYDIMMQCCDEAVFQTPNWDQMVTAKFDESRDKIILVHGRDGIQDAGLATMGFVHRRWVDAVGYFCPPYFSCDYNDLWLTEVADALRRRVYIAEMLVEHMHPVVGKATLDRTHRERLDRGTRDNVGSLYRQLESKRHQDVSRLAAAIAAGVK